MKNIFLGKNAGYTDQKIADILGISNVALSGYKNNKKSLYKAIMLGVFCQENGITPELLVSAVSFFEELQKREQILKGGENATTRD